MGATAGDGGEAIYEAVREQILSGALSPPGPLRQEALAQSLGVSKIPLREALVRLEQDGLLSQQRNRGFFVRPLDAAEAEEVFALRLMLEPDCVALACRLASPDEQDEAARALEALETEISAQGPRISVLNRAFHLALARPARRPVTLALLERLHVLADRYVRKHLEPEGRGARARIDHRLLLDRWTGRSEAEVRSLAARHVETTLADLRSQLAPAG